MPPNVNLRWTRDGLYQRFVTSLVILLLPTESDYLKDCETGPTGFFSHGFSFISRLPFAKGCLAYLYGWARLSKPWNILNRTRAPECGCFSSNDGSWYIVVVLRKQV